MCHRELLYYLVSTGDKISDAITAGLKTPTWDGWLTFFGTVFVGIVATGITIYHERKHNKDERKKAIVDLLDKLISVSITYPILESEEFARRYKKNPVDEAYMRYDNYCCMIYNFISRLWRFANKDTAKMSEIAYYEEYIMLHRVWWEENQEENINGYGKDFYDFVENVYKNCLQTQQNTGEK